MAVVADEAAQTLHQFKFRKSKTNDALLCKSFCSVFGIPDHSVKIDIETKLVVKEQLLEVNSAILFTFLRRTPI